jgi:indolepyruvate ferredoxin oxidoreductase beta subunit
MKSAGNIIFCGVGGQGILLASEIASDALMKAGFDVKRSEVHGMAQRGGSVIAHLRYGEKVYSPVIDPGAADVQVAFEMLEALRYLPYLHANSRVIVNTQKIPPAPVSTGVEKYPEGIIEQLKSRELAVHPVDAQEIGRALGEPRASNLALVGALSTLLPAEEAVFRDAIKFRVPAKFLQVNMKAFDAGREAMRN